MNVPSISPGHQKRLILEHLSLSVLSVCIWSLRGPWRCPQDISGDRDAITVNLTPVGNSSVARGVPVTILLFLILTLFGVSVSGDSQRNCDGNCLPRT